MTVDDPLTTKPHMNGHVNADATPAENEELMAMEGKEQLENVADAERQCNNQV